MNIGTSINARMASSLMAEDMSDASSTESTQFDDSDLLNTSVHDDVTAQLAAAGPIGVAAAAAIATGKKRKRPHSFETNPSIRKRQQTRLLRKLKATIEEYTTRVGQQAIVLCVTPGKASTSSNTYKVFGSQPLENVIRNCRGMVMQDLDASLAQQAPPQQPDNPSLHELPPLIIDGIPTPVDKMTQAQLRNFIPLMLKYSTGRGKPGWGKEEYRPLWWPSDVPWANVRSDVRIEDIKQKVSWTHALRTIVKNCYKHHGRDDLLPEFEDALQAGHYGQPTMVQTINNPDGTVSIIQIDTGTAGNAVVTLGDGTQATVVHAVQQNGPTHEANQAVQTLAEVAANQQHEGVVHAHALEMTDSAAHAVATLAEATINQDGQIILTGESLGEGTATLNDARMMKLCLSKDLFGNTATDQKFGMVTIPVSMYQTVVTSIAQLQDSNNQTIQQVTPKSEGNGQSGDVPDATHAVEVMSVEQT